MASINRAEPGLLRVEADETTYSLHIILRFDLERRLIEGTLARDVPEAWNESMRELLGVDVPDDARGALQDIHWSGGGIGYFRPTRSETSSRSRSGRSCARRFPTSTRRWKRASSRSSTVARENLYSLGRKFTPKETIERLTGAPAIDPQPYLAYLREKLSALAA